MPRRSIAQITDDMDQVFAVQLAADGKAMIVFQKHVHAQAFANQYNSFHDPKTEKEEAEVHAWRVMKNAHKYHPLSAPLEGGTRVHSRRIDDVGFKTPVDPTKLLEEEDEP